MNIGSLCSRPAVTIDGRESARHAAELMRAHHVAGVVVTEATADGVHVAGIVTDRDLVVGVLATGNDAAAVPVWRLVGERPVGAVEQTGLAEAVALMGDSGRRNLLVHDATGHLVGLLSVDDLLRACLAPLAGLSALLAKGTDREAASHVETAPAPRPPVRVPAMGTVGWRP